MTAFRNTVFGRAISTLAAATISRDLLRVCWLVLVAAIAIPTVGNAAVPPLTTPVRMQDDGDELDLDVEAIINDTLLQKEQSVFIPAPREVLRPLIRARRAIEEREMGRAVSLLGEVLADATLEDYLVPLPDIEGVSVSLHFRAQQMLSALSPEDRQLYRLRYGVQAKQMLNQAIEGGDVGKVSQVMRRFFFTDAGFEATMLLGHHHLDQGRPAAAASCFELIVSSDEAREKYDPEVSVLLATCWMLNGSNEQARKTLVEFRSRTSDNSIEFLGQPVNLFVDPANALPWLKDLVGSSPLAQINFVNQWVMVGGNPQRNARSGDGFPLISPRWRTPTLNDPDLEASVRRRQRDLVQLDASPIPAVQPLAVDNTIVMRTFDRMIGVDFETGKRKWVFPPADFTARFDQVGQPLTERQFEARPLTERLWLDSVYGQASSDGRRVFVVPNPGFSTDAVESAGEGNSIYHRTFNELIAVDIRREGALLWEVGGDTGKDEPKLANAFFLGPPLPLQEQLYAVCQQGTDIKLVVLDSSSGQVQWERQLGTTETSQIRLLDDRFRRLAGCTPSFANGTLVCATGTGALVAIDVSTRSLLWGFQYTTPGRRPVQPISPTNKSGADPLNGLWRDSTIVIAENKVLFTPVDSQDLICVELQSGLPAWRQGNRYSAKSPRFNSLYLACVESGLAVLVGESSVRAVDLRTGKVAWTLSIEDYGRPSGRGYANNGSYFFPTTNKLLLRVNLSDGVLQKVVGTGRLLGNLIGYQGEIISHGVDEVAVFPQEGPNRQRLLQAKTRGELTPDLLAIESQLLLQDGDIAGATAAIEQAYNQAPTLRNEGLFLDLILQLMKRDFETAIPLATKYEASLLEKRRYEFLTNKVAGLIASQNDEPAVELLLSMLDPLSELDRLTSSVIEVSARQYDLRSELVADPVGDVTQERDQKGNGRVSPDDPPAWQAVVAASADDASAISVRLDRWVVSQLEAIESNGSAQARSQMYRLLARSFQSTELLPPKKRMDCLRLFPQRWVDPAIKLSLAVELHATGQPTSLAWLQDAIAHADAESNASRAVEPELLCRAVGQVAWRLSIGGDRIGAGPFLERLTSEFADVVAGEFSFPNLPAEHGTIDSHSTMASKTYSGRELAERLRIVPPLARPSVAANWNRGRVLATELDEPTLETESEEVPCRLKLVEADADFYRQLHFRFHGNLGELEVLDRDMNTLSRFLLREQDVPLTPRYSGAEAGRISIRKQLALVDIGQELFVFDWAKMCLKQPPVLWNRLVKSDERDQATNSISLRWGESSTSPIPSNYETRVFAAPPSVNGICYLDGSRVVCADWKTGNVIWERQGAISGSRVFGDSENLVVWNLNRRRGVILDPATGQLLKRVELPKSAGEIWRASGTKLLLSGVKKRKQLDGEGSRSADSSNANVQGAAGVARSDSPQGMVKTLGIFDLLSEQFDWQGEHAGNTFGCLTDDNRIIVVPPQGNLRILDLDTGQQLSEFKIELGDQRGSVVGVGYLKRQGRYLVFLKIRDLLPSSFGFEGRQFIVRLANYNEAMWHAAVISIDPTTGKNFWDQPARIWQFQVLQDCPDEVPVQFFVRRTRVTEKGETTENLQFAGIDLETGQLLINHLSPTTRYRSSYLFTLRADQATHSLLVNYGDGEVKFDLKAAEADAPPRPTAFLNRSSAMPLPSPSVSFGSIDRTELEAAIDTNLQRALAAEKALDQKRTAEKRRLEAERSAK